MKITTAHLITGCGANAAIAGVWLNDIQATMDKFGVSDTAERAAMYLANIGVETFGLTKFSEDLMYTATRLAEVWPFRYAIDPHTKQLQPNLTAVRIANNPTATANNVYANRMGNGPEASGDGWRFHGRGLPHMTGRYMYEKFFSENGLAADTDPDSLMSPPNGALAGAWFFAKGSQSMVSADAKDFSSCVLHFNGARPCAANQGPLRQARYEAVLALLAAPAATAKPKSAATAKSTTSSLPPPPQE